jgi:hypothetical protein
MDRDWYQDRRLDREVERLEGQHREADDATIESLAALAKRLSAVEKELARQNLAVTLLTQLLMERGAVDGAELRKRFEAAMSQAQAQANLVSCARCKKQVEKRATHITSFGPYCTACYNELEG